MTHTERFDAPQTFAPERQTNLSHSVRNLYGDMPETFHEGRPEHFSTSALEFNRESNLFGQRLNDFQPTARSILGRNDEGGQRPGEKDNDIDYFYQPAGFNGHNRLTDSGWMENSNNGNFNYNNHEQMMDAREARLLYEMGFMSGSGDARDLAGLAHEIRHIERMLHHLERELWHLFGGEGGEDGGCGSRPYNPCGGYWGQPGDGGTTNPPVPNPGNWPGDTPAPPAPTPQPVPTPTPTPTPNPGDGGTGNPPSNDADLNALVHFDSGVPASIRQQILQTLDNSPKAIKDAMRQDKPDIEVVSGGAQQGAAAYFDPGNNQVVIYSGTGMEVEAAEHEFAHVWDAVDGVQNDSRLQQLALQDTSANPGAVQRIAGVLADGPTLTNGVNMGDLFAEAAAGIAGDDQTGIPSFIAQNFPNFYNYLKQKELA